MGRKRRRSKDRMVPEQRVYLHNPTKIVSAAPRSIVRKIEDRREYAPVETYPRGLFHRSTKLLVADANVNKARRNEVPRRVVFNVPPEVALCVRRKERREVLFALNKTGKGARRKNRRRTIYSKMECK